MGQKIFKVGLVNHFLNKVNKDEDNFASLYFDKKRFEYKFDDSTDLVNSDIDNVSSEVGQEMVRIFLKNRKDEKSTDFRTADFECAKFLFQSLNLTRRQASNADFWNYLHHTIFYEYIHLRWNKISEQTGETLKTYIHRHWLMDRSSQKHLINFPLTTLWWSIFITKDDSREDPFELAKIYFQNNRFRTVSFGGSSFVRHKEAILGILEYFKENKLQMTSDLGDEVAKFINLLGGTKPLSFFGRSWFKNRLYDRYGDGEIFPVSDTIYDEKHIVQLEANGSKNGSTRKLTDSKAIKHFNLNLDGNYRLSTVRDKNFTECIKITEGFSDGYLMLCYNESGFINRVTIKSLLRRKRDLYQNGLYKGNTLRKLLVIPEKAIIGITYKYQGVKYFKAHLSECFKKDNEIVGLQGYKTLYTKYDEGTVDYEVFPIQLLNKLHRLVFDSLQASGKAYTNTNFKKEFETINNYLNKSPTLFDI